MLMIRDLSPVERPREKLHRYGVEKLTNEELLAIILGSGRNKQSAIDVARLMLKQCTLQQLADSDAQTLQNIPGIGMAKASAVVALFELGKRTYQDKKTTLVMTPQHVAQSLHDICASKKEHLIVFFLNTRNQMIAKETVSIGTVDASIVHPREVFEPAIKHTASQILIAHNHPSGDPTPSAEDHLVTKRMLEAGKILGIDLVDHVIVTRDSYYSYRENGVI